MNCDEAQELLQHALDGQPVGDRAGLDQHLSACPDCRLLHLAAARLEEGLRLWVPALPPPRFAVAVADRVLADQRARRRGRRWLTAAAVAAGLLVAVGLGLNSSGWQAAQDYVAGLYRPQPPAPPAPAPAPPVVPPADKPEPPPSPIDLVTQSGSVVKALPRRVAEESALAKWSLPMDVLPALPDVGPMDTAAEEPALLQASQSLSEARNGMALAWEVVESPMRRATSAWSQLTPALQKQ